MEQNARTTSSPIHVSTLFYAQFNTTPSSASVSYFVGAFPSNINSRQSNAAVTLMIFSHFYFVPHQFITSFNQSIAIIIPVLTAFLQLKYQGINDENNTPFQTHPATMLVAVSGSVVYCFAYIELLRFPECRHLCLVCSGYASVASLASILVPDSVGPLVYAIFALISGVELLNVLYSKLLVEEGGEFQVYRTRVRRFLNNIRRVNEASFSGQRLQILPI